MSIFQPVYLDKKTGERKRSAIWWYDFTYAGRRYKESANTTLQTLAHDAGKQRQRELEQGINAVRSTRKERIAPIAELVEDFLEDHAVKTAEVRGVREIHALAHVNPLLGSSMAADITDKAVIKYQTTRLKEKAAPKT